MIRNNLASEFNVIKESERNELSEKLKIEINKLPDKYKIPFMLKFMEEKNYQEIKNELSVGLDTITRVQKWLKEGYGGYVKEIQNIKNKNDIKQKEEVNQNSLAGLANRYPLYWGLTNEIHKLLKNKNKK